MYITKEELQTVQTALEELQWSKRDKNEKQFDEAWNQINYIFDKNRKW